MKKEVISLYEKFLKDNNLLFGPESAKEFCDLYENNYDIELLSDEYVQYAQKLKTKNSRFEGYKKAYLLSLDNIVAKILMYENKRDLRNDTINTKEIPFSPYNGKVGYLEFLKDEVNLEYADLLTNNLYNPKSDIDIMNVGYKGRAYIWVLRTLYFAYISNFDFDNAIKTGESILAINKSDYFDILLSLPYLYINTDQIDNATSLLKMKKDDTTDMVLLKSVTSFFNDNYELCIKNLKELDSKNSSLLKFIITNYS
nr:hypothetical protein [Acholeplasmatales bacterium]